jgi:hypothetical protein
MNKKFFSEFPLLLLAPQIRRQPQKRDYAKPLHQKKRGLRQHEVTDMLVGQDNPLPQQHGHVLLDHDLETAGG